MGRLTIEELRKLIRYDEVSGKLYWLVWMGNHVTTGMEALGAKKDSGHKSGLIKSKHYLAHRVAWALHYGEWPSGAIDHINGNKVDNRIENLRVVTMKQNSQNRRPIRNKSSGLPQGVSVTKSGHIFAQIWVNGKNKYLGRFNDVESAKLAYDAAAKEYGFHPNHGKTLEAIRALRKDTP